MAGWIIFGGLVALLMFLDLKGNRNQGTSALKKAIIIVCLNVLLVIAFALYIYATDSTSQALTFTSAYLIELSLSIDNVFVFVLIFQFFHIPKNLQHRVLFWGILSAILMRGVIIAGGIWLMSHLHWIIYIFGIILLWSAWRLLLPKPGTSNNMNQRYVNFVKKFIPVSEKLVGNKFWVRVKGKRRIK